MADSDAPRTRRQRAPWLLLQLADAAFPSGGFAHSGGLEATVVLGSSSGADGADVVTKFLDASLTQLGRAALPFVRATATEPSRLAELDDVCDATFSMLAPNRASRAQGRALASAASRIWNEVHAVGEHARSGPAHHAPVFGAIFGALGVDPDEVLAVYLHGALRNILSAGIRLGLLGPLEAQRVHAERAELCQAILERSHSFEPANAAQTTPLIEMFAALHDRLDGRMFQS